MTRCVHTEVFVAKASAGDADLNALNGAICRACGLVREQRARVAAAILPVGRRLVFRADKVVVSVVIGRAVVLRAVTRQ